MTAHEDEQWRVTFARILLCVSMIFYLVLIAAIPIVRMTSQEAQSVAVLIALIGLSAFAAVALNRKRRASIAVPALLALFTVAGIVRSAFYLRLPFARPKSGWDVVEVVGMLIAASSIAIPIVVFIVTWPLRKVTLAGQSSANVTRDS